MKKRRGANSLSWYLINKGSWHIETGKSPHSGIPHEFTSLKICVPRVLLSYAPNNIGGVQNSAEYASCFTAAYSLCSAALLSQL